MFAYPPQAAVNRAVAKAKIYAHAKASKRLQGLFVAQVGEIVWKFKLAPETIRLPARGGIDEIQVFEIAAKGDEVDDDVLRAIDKAVPFPIAFELIHGSQVQFAISYKRRSDADAAKWVLETTFRTAPESRDAPRPPMPVALDLASLYDQIVRKHIPLAPRRDESIAEQVARLALLEAKKRARLQIKKRLANEKQFNRRVTLNSELRSLAAEVAALEQA